MKIGVAGKGGTGKTSIAATLARVYAGRGLRVLAIDADSNPNLAVSLGIDGLDARRLRTMPSRAFDESRTVASLLDEFSIIGPDGVRLVLAARIDRAGSG